MHTTRIVVGMILGSMTLWSGVFAQSSCLQGSQNIERTYLGTLSAEGLAHEKSLANLLINVQETTDQRKGLIYHFCDTVLGTRPDDLNMENTCFSYDTYTYDSRQSLFLYALCVNTEARNNDPIYPERKYIQEFQAGDVLLGDYIVEGLDLHDLWGLPTADSLDAGQTESPCDPRLSMQACDFSSFLPDIMEHIMNAYGDMKLATLYGYNNILQDASPEDQKKQREDAIQQFSEAYFSPPDRPKQSASDNECGEAGLTYISKVQSEGDKKHCSHPKTYTAVEETIRSAQQLVEKVDRLTADTIIAKDCTDPEQHLMVCALSNEGHYFGDTDRKHWQNLIANELMFFNLFANYYTQQILDKVTYNPLSIGSYSFSATRNQEEFYAMQRETQLLNAAVQQMKRMLTNVYVYYPIHVGMLANIEDALVYRASLAPLYQPMNQRSYLSRNVQSCGDAS